MSKRRTGRGWVPMRTRSQGGAAGGDGGKTKGEELERGGRWEGVAPRGIAGRPAGHNHGPSSGA